MTGWCWDRGKENSEAYLHIRLYISLIKSIMSGLFQMKQVLNTNIIYKYIYIYIYIYIYFFFLLLCLYVFISGLTKHSLAVWLATWPSIYLPAHLPVSLSVYLHPCTLVCLHSPTSASSRLPVGEVVEVEAAAAAAAVAVPVQWWQWQQRRRRQQQ